MRLLAALLIVSTLGAQQLVNWPDRRRLCQWITAKGDAAQAYVNRTANNPRSYYDNTAAPLSNPSGFRTTMLNWADTVITNCKSTMNPPCQGVIIWDLEGQEFAHALTYVGAPDKLAEHAPEMDTIADELFAKFRNAGLRTGLTIRPQRLLYGTTTSATCSARGGGNERDYFINTSAYTFPSGTRSYLCSADNTWTAEAFNDGYGYQPWAVNEATAKQILAEKIEYAKRRWGTTIFYIDTNVYGTGGGTLISNTTWRELQTQFPDVLLMPEASGNVWAAWEVFAPYDEMDSPDFLYRTGPGVRAAVPESFSLINASDGAMTENASTIRLGIGWGDMYMQRCWFSDGQITTMNGIQQAANPETGSVSLTDSAISGTRTYTGSPRTAYTYPLVLRVAFSTSSTFTGAETTYCERRDVTYCWAAGVKQGSATLALASFTHVRREYRDFHGRLVSAGVAETK